MIKKAEEKGVKLLLPVDAVAADAFSNDADTKVVAQNEIPTDGWDLTSDLRLQKCMQRL